MGARIIQIRYPFREERCRGTKRVPTVRDDDAAVRKLIRTYPLAFAVGLLLLLLFFGNRIATSYTDWLWFVEVGKRGVFARIYGARLLLFGVFGAASFLLAYANVALADRFAPSSRTRAGKSSVFLVSTDRPVGRTLQLLSGFRPVLNALLLLGALIFAIIAGLSAQLEWDSFLRFTHPERFGVRDPQFGADIGFYVFTLPFVRYVQGWLLTVLLLIGAGVTLTYVYQRGVDSASGRAAAFDAPHVRAHLSALAGLALLVKAWGYYLDRYDLMFRDGSSLFTGAGYADIHARLPMLQLLVGVTVLAAVGVFVNIWRRTLVLPAATLTLWLAFSAAGVLIPATVQQLRVRPNEAAREAPYLQRALVATREAYDLADVEVRPLPAETTLTAADLKRNHAVVGSIRLWDYEPLLETYPQQQGLRQYYTFPDVDVDRYALGGEAGYQQVMIAVREIAPERLDPRAQTWPNVHLRYTHGFGAVVSAAGRVSGDGLPEYLLKDVPPTPAPGASTLHLTEPRVYYGAGSPLNSYAVVRTGQAEFDFPEENRVQGPAEHENRYRGQGGIPLTPLARWAFAARFPDGINLMLNSDIGPESRLLMLRRVPDRVKRIAPFLRLDSDPYPVIARGRIVWVQDAYTTSGAYPYSAFSSGSDGLSSPMRFNYIRNAVKAVVDGYDGSVSLYAADEKDPILRSYRRIFPELIRPAVEMPAEIRAHRRYPEDLFAIQRRILADYHVQDAGVFYSRADSWQLPRAQSTVEDGAVSFLETENEAMAPYYMLLRLPGETKEEFVLLSPFTPRSRENMIALFAARSDGEHYGKRVLYRFPTTRTVFGPQQVGRRIRSDNKISPYLSLVDQKGSRVLFGSMLVVLVEKSLLYVQPLYVKAQYNPMEGQETRSVAVRAASGASQSLPELKQVVVAYENRIAMQPTLEAALADLFGSRSSEGEKGTSAASEEPDGTSAATTAVLIERASAQYERAQKALRAGDFSTYGRETQALGATLRRLRGQTLQEGRTPEEGANPVGSKDVGSKE